MRISRAGRKAMIYRAFVKRHNRNKNACVTVGQMARMIGMKSSTHLKNIMREMCEEFDEIWMEESEDTTFFFFAPYVQIELQSRMIAINAKGNTKGFLLWQTNANI